MNMQYNPEAFIYGANFLNTNWQNQQSDSPNFICLEYAQEYHKFSLTERFELGADGLKDLLPKLPNEENKTYKARQDAITLDNMVVRLSQSATGTIMRKEVQLTDVPPFLARILENKVDKELGLNEFTKKAIYHFIRDAGGWLQCDSPREKDSDEQPYMQLLPRSKVINWRYNTAGELELAVVYETMITNAGRFGSKTVQRFRAYEMVEGLCHVTIYEYEAGTAKTTGSSYTIIEEIKTDFTFIPLVELKTNSNLMYAIALKNLRQMHFQSLLDRYLTIAALPQPVFYGADTDEDEDENIDNKSQKPALILGVDNALFFDTKDGGFEWAEMSGKSTELIQSHIERLNEDMLQALERSKADQMKQSNQSATASHINNKAQQSFLVNISGYTENAIKRAIEMLGEMVGEKTDKVEFTINKDFTPAVEASNANSLLQAYTAGALSQETLLISLNNMELTQIKDIEEEIKKTEAEGIIDEEQNFSKGNSED